MKVKEKRRMLGTIRFISHLFRISFLSNKIIENCIIILIRNAENADYDKELMTEYAVDLMKHVGPHLTHRKEEITKLNGYVSYLEKFKPLVSNRVKFMIIDLVELRDKKWVKKDDGPKAKNEVVADVVKGAKDNKRASNKGGNQRVITRQSVDARKSTAQRDNKTSIAPILKIDSRSASTTPPPNDLSSSGSQNKTPTVASEDQFNKAAFKAGFKERLQSHLDNNADIDATVKSLIEFSNELNNPVLFFEQMFKYCCEHLKLSGEKELHTVSALVAKCCKDPVWKNAFAPAFKKYCKYLVDEDVDGDLPHLKTIFPQFVARLMTDTNGVSNLEFVEGFKEFYDSANAMFARTLAEFGRILHGRNESAGGPLGFVFDEFATADEHYKSDDMQKILANQPIDYDENHKNL
uniref:MIF4G domain-containing protein n=1 Tax=Panagrolaimus sp. PS1159 TaxID=55785 RepID=A0AC35FU30_9BILA